MSHLIGNSLASLKLGDFFQEGFGGIKKDVEKALQYYKDSKGAEIITDPFKLSHADFNLGMLHLFNKTSTNITNDLEQSESYFNSSISFEELTYFPIKIAQFYFRYLYKGKFGILFLIKKFLFDYTIGSLSKNIFFSWEFYAIIITIFLYGLFYISLLNQKD